MKKFNVPCDFGGVKAPFTFYVGQPSPKNHPIQFQSDWLSKHRGGIVPGDVMEKLSKISDLAKKNNVPFEDLCEYALSSDDEKDASELPPEPV